MTSRQNAIKISAENRRKWSRIILEQQEKLLENNINVADLKAVLQYLSPITYNEVCIERATQGFCGYPLCDEPYKLKDVKYKIVNNRIIDAQKIQNFCCKNCWVASEYLKSQLKVDAIYVRTFTDSPNFDLLPPKTQFKSSKPDENIISEELKNMSLSASESDDSKLSYNDAKLVKKSKTIMLKDHEVQSLLNKSKGGAAKIKSSGKKSYENISSITSSLREIKITERTAKILDSIEIKPNDIQVNGPFTVDFFPQSSDEIEGYIPKHKPSNNSSRSTRPKIAIKSEESITTLAESSHLSSEEQESSELNLNFDFYDSEDDDQPIEIVPTIFTSIWTILSGFSSYTQHDQKNKISSNSTVIAHLKQRVFKTVASHSLNPPSDNLDIYLNKFNYAYFNPALSRNEELILCSVILSLKNNEWETIFHRVCESLISKDAFLILKEMVEN